MLVSLLITASAFFGMYIDQTRPETRSNIIHFKVSNGRPVLNKWFNPKSPKDFSLYKTVILNIDDGIFPDASSKEVSALNPNDEYTDTILKALLELSELPEPDIRSNAAKYTRGPFTRPTDGATFTIRRVGDQRYKMDVKSTGRHRRSAEEDVGDEEEDHKKKPKSSVSKKENETTKKEKEKDKGDGGRIVGGVSSLQFTNVNHKFRSGLPG